MSQEEFEKLEIEFKLGLDPEYINKSKESICKDCIHNLGFNKQFYDCEKAALNFGFDLVVYYKEEGMFHSQIIKCNEYVKIILVIGLGLIAERVN